MLRDLLIHVAALLSPLAPPPAPPPPPPTPPPAPAPVEAPPPAPQPAQEPPAPVAEAESTAYCLTGRMASGERAHVGAVASNRYPLGTRLWLDRSPWGAREFVVRDRIGHGSELDIAMPGDCRGAKRWGRRVVGVTPL